MKFSQQELVQIEFSESNSEILRDALEQSRTWNRTQIVEFYSSNSSMDEPSLHSKVLLHVEPSEREYMLRFLNVSTLEPKFVEYGNSALTWLRTPPGAWTCCHPGYNSDAMYTYYLRDDLEILTVEETSSEVVYTVAGESVRSADIEDDFDVQIIINKSHPPRVSQIIETSIDDPNSNRQVVTFRNVGTTTVERPDTVPKITANEVVLSFDKLLESHVF